MQWSLFLLFVVGQSSFITCHQYEYHYIAEKQSWEEAQKYCRDKYTDLATISNMTDMKRLEKSATDQEEPAWIGLYNQTDFNDTWYWSLPGMEFNENETEWKKGEPDNREGKENCGGIKGDEKWIDLTCDANRTFICYDAKNEKQRFVFIETKMTWLNAQRFCRQNHTDLISGPQQIAGSVSNMTDSLKGLYMFTGLFKDRWGWSDGSSFSFRHWNSSFNSNQCATVTTETRRWGTDVCEKEKPFFCYDDKVILVQKKMNWEDALYYCQEHHYDLVSITDLDEQRWIQEKVKNANTDFVWMGLRYTCTLDFWFWVSNEGVSYENWASNRTMNDCDMSGAMSKEGGHKWFKKKDMEKFNFLCSKE